MIVHISFNKITNYKYYIGRTVPTILVFYVMFCTSLFVLLSFFLSVIILSVALLFTPSDCPFWYIQIFPVDADNSFLMKKDFLLLLLLPLSTSRTLFNKL